MSLPPPSDSQPSGGPSPADYASAGPAPGVYCNRCGHRNPAGSQFCSSCGSTLEQPEDVTTTFTIIPVEGVDLTDEEPQMSVDVPEGMGMLIVRRGPNAGATYVLEQPVTQAGRHPESEIFLDDITVSRRHVEFAREAGSYTVLDVGSLNGTYVNKERIEDRVGLSNGDEVQIGKFKLVFLTGAPVGH